MLVMLPSLAATYYWWPEHAKAAALGVAIEMAGRAYFAYHAFRFIGARQASLVLRSLKRGEAGKFLMVAISFGALFLLAPDISPVAVFTGYLASWFFGTAFSIRLLK